MPIPPLLPMLSTESTLVRAFTKRRSPNVVSPPPAPPLNQEAFQRRQAALRQMGLMPALSLSQQEAQLDSFIPPSSPLNDPIRDSEADRIKNDWVVKNNSPHAFPSPTPDFPGTAIENTETPSPTSEPTPDSDSDSDSSAPLTPQSEMPSIPSDSTKPSNFSIPPVNLILDPPSNSTLDVIQESLPDRQQPNSPISAEFLPPESPHSPAHLHPHDDIPSSFRSRSPSLAGSSTKSARSRSKSRTRGTSPLRFFVRAKVPEEPLPPLPASPTTEEAKTETLATQIPPPQDAKAETPHPPQRKKTVFARFKRANTVNPSSPSSQSRQKDPQPQAPSRSKSLFTSVKKSVFGLTATGGGGDVITTTPDTLDANPNLLPPIATSNSNLGLLASIFAADSPPSSSTTATAAAAQDSDSESPQPKPDVVLEDKPIVTPEAEVPFGSSADAQSGQEGPLGKVQFPTTDDGQESVSNLDHDRERSSSLCTTNLSVNTSTTPRKGIGLGISLVLNRERTKSSSPLPSSPPTSPLSSTFLSPPASPTSISVQGGRLRGRLGRKGTIGSGTEGLLSVWGGVAGLLGGAPSIVTNGSGTDEGADGEVRQALAPTIHNQASILHHMSNIEDEETRRVTELAFM